MKPSKAHNEKIEKLTFASVFPHYINKIEKKGRSKSELLQITEWLTGFNKNQLQELIDNKVKFKTFFVKLHYTKTQV